MTLEHKYYSFEEMPEWYEFIRQGSIYKYRKVGGKLECYVGGEQPETTFDYITSIIGDELTYEQWEIKRWKPKGFKA